MSYRSPARAGRTLQSTVNSLQETFEKVLGSYEARAGCQCLPGRTFTSPASLGTAGAAPLQGSRQATCVATQEIQINQDLAERARVRGAQWARGRCAQHHNTDLRHCHTQAAPCGAQRSAYQPEYRVVARAFSTSPGGSGDAGAAQQAGQQAEGGDAPYDTSSEALMGILPDLSDLAALQDAEASPAEWKRIRARGREVLDQIKSVLVERITEDVQKMRKEMAAAEADAAAASAPGTAPAAAAAAKASSALEEDDDINDDDDEDEEAEAEEDDTAVNVEVSDEEARRVIAFALGSGAAASVDRMVGVLGALPDEPLAFSMAALLNFMEESVGEEWQLLTGELLEKDASMRFFRSMLLCKLHNEGYPLDTFVASRLMALKDASDDVSGGAEDTRRRGDRERGGGDNEPLTEEEIAALGDAGSAALSRTFFLLQNHEGAVTLQEFLAMDALIAGAKEAGDNLSYSLLVEDEGPQVLMKLMISHLMKSVSEPTRERMVEMMRDDVKLHVAGAQRQGPLSETHRPDSLLMFLSEHISLLQGCKDEHRDEVVQGLLDAYLLQSQPVLREFIPPARGELPPEIAHSPMKPLGQEISHRASLLINLYPPQRVAWGAFVDLHKIVRPQRAKNLLKRVKYDHPRPNREVW